MANSYDEVIRLSQQGLDQINAKLKISHELVLKNANALNDIFLKTGVQNLKQLNALTEKYNKQTLKLEDAQKKLSEQFSKQQTISKANAVATANAIKREKELVKEREKSNAKRLKSAEDLIKKKKQRDAEYEAGFKKLLKEEEKALKVKYEKEFALLLKEEKLLEKNRLAKIKASKVSQEKVSKELTDEMLRQVNAIGKVNPQLKKLNSYYKELESSSAKLASETTKANKARVAEADRIASNKKALNNQRKQAIALREKEAAEASKVAKSIAEQKARNTELNRAYVKLVNQQKQAKKVLQDLIVSKGKDNILTKKAQKEYDTLTKKVNLANKATSNFSKTGLGSAVRGFKNLLGAFGIIGGVQMFASMTQEIFKMVKKLESLEFALKAVTNGTGELIRTQEFLSKISNKFGASIVGTTERYIKFLAAAKQSNVSMKETEKIFSVVTKAAGVLGLKTDELSGIYLALEQMLSKGKVTTEELRRQLGERLPGAFGIMADALGVTTRELDKMLRKGEILSSEALPKFAEQLENIPYLKNAKDIDTVVASQNRLNNSWIELIQNIEEGNGGLSSFFKTLIDGTTGVIDALSQSEQASDGFFSFFNNLMKYQQGLGGLVVSEAVLNKAKETRIKLTKELGDLMRRDLKGKVIELEIERRVHNLRNLTLEQLSDEIARLNEKEKLINDISLKDKTITLMELESMTIDELKQKWKELFGIKEDENKKTVSYIKGSIAYYEAQISLAKKNINEQTLTREEYQKQIKVIDDLSKKLNNLKTELYGLEEVDTLDFSNIGLDDFTIDGGVNVNGIKDVIDPMMQIEDMRMKLMEEGIVLKADTSDIDELVKKLKNLENLKDIFGTVTDTFSKMFDIDISKFDFLFDGLENSVSDWADLSKELIGSVLDASLQRYEIELQTAQRTRDLILNDELATEEQKEAARREYEEKERRIKTEQARQERENTLIKIAVDTAAAVVKATAQTGTLAPFVIPSILAIGAAQAAIVAAQPLPQFFDGVENSTYEGLATKDEKGAELHFDKYGNIKDLGQNKGAKLTHVAKGDTIIPALQTKSILDGLTNENIQRAVLDINGYSNGEIISQNSVDERLLNKIDMLSLSNEKVWKEVKKIASRPINNNVKVEVKNEIPY